MTGVTALVEAAREKRHRRENATTTLFEFELWRLKYENKNQFSTFTNKRQDNKEKSKFRNKIEREEG